MNPTQYRVSPHFALSDFLGCHSVFADGLPNMLDPNDPEIELKLANIKALAVHVLEPILETYGPMSIGYSFLSPATSRVLVKYQDPDKPSHHLWNLGAAADICVHRWVNSEPERDDQQNSPFNLALFGIHSRLQLPYSRLISYSESPYLCVAASQREIVEGNPRQALYENRLRDGRTAPAYFKYPSQKAKTDAVADRLFSDPLEAGWRGVGYPARHSLKIRQLHHRRVSKYTMLTDWLFDLFLVTNGARNVPKKSHTDLLHKAGNFYDALIDATGYNRFSIIQGFHYDRWTIGTPHFALKLPENADGPATLTEAWIAARAFKYMTVDLRDDKMIVTLR